MKLAKQALSDGDTVLQKLEDSTVTEMQAQRDALRQTIVKAQSRIEVLEKMIARLYEDMISGRFINEFLISARQAVHCRYPRISPSDS